jgi:hypothetical protein
MDFLRSCYTAEVRYLQGSDARGYITWQPAAPGASAYPHPHAFSSTVWEQTDPSPVGPIGEVDRRRVWAPNVVSPFAGNHNTLDSYIALHGIPPSALALPAPATYCGLSLKTSTGGLVFGGASTASREPVEDSKGGLVFGGTYVVTPLTGYVLSRGGIVIGTSGGPPPPVVIISTGGVILGGQSSESAVVESTGGLILGGQSLVTVFSTGGVILGGQGSETPVQIVQPFGPIPTSAIRHHRAGNAISAGFGFMR